MQTTRREQIGLEAVGGIGLLLLRLFFYRPVAEAFLPARPRRRWLNGSMDPKPSRASSASGTRYAGGDLRSQASSGQVRR